MHVNNFEGFTPPQKKIGELKTVHFLTVLTSYQPSVNARHNYGASEIRWRRMANVNRNIVIKSLVSRGPQNFQFTMESRRAALSGNTSLISAFSSSLYTTEEPESPDGRIIDGPEASGRRLPSLPFIPLLPFLPFLLPSPPFSSPPCPFPPLPGGVRGSSSGKRGSEGPPPGKF